MKKLLSIVLSLAITSGSFAQNGFTVKAKINNPQNYTLCLAYIAGQKTVTDTNYTLTDGWYIFKGSVPEPVVAQLTVRGNPALTIKLDNATIPAPPLNFFLVNEEITIAGDVNTIYLSTVNGGSANADWNLVRKKESELSHETWMCSKRMYEALAKGDSVSFGNEFKARTLYFPKLRQVQREFIRENPNSPVSAYFMANLINSFTPRELRAAYNKLGNDAQNNLYGRRVAERINNLSATAVGKDAVTFSKKDMNGNVVDLESLKGKYVLIDFWGSWCKPCRKGHPHLKEIYAKYKSQGLEIVGVAHEMRPTLEACRTAWLNAIKQDGIDWIQILNNEEAEISDVVKAYGVSAYPTRILLDKDGKVLARYIGEERNQLNRQLRKIFGN